MSQAVGDERRIVASYPSAMKEYDEEQELMGYVWRNYCQIMRPDECIAKRVRDALPAELRDEYWAYIECVRAIEESQERDPWARCCVMDSQPIPEMRPELLDAVSAAHEALMTPLFWEKFLPHARGMSINRCPRCQRILVNEKSRQCLWCGHDWH